MNFSKTSKKFLSQSAEAYYKFEHHEIPFAAVKIYICGLECYWEKLDDIVRENFRSENDFFFWLQQIQKTEIISLFRGFLRIWTLMMRKKL